MMYAILIPIQNFERYKAWGKTALMYAMYLALYLIVT
jgi:hypothetical protein